MIAPYEQKKWELSLKETERMKEKQEEEDIG